MVGLVVVPVGVGVDDRRMDVEVSVAFAHLQRDADQHEASGKRDARDLESVAAKWERAVRDAFLAGYLGVSSGRAGLLPSSRAGIDALIALFELEKTFYELGYELNNRPEWVWIPMRGASRRGSDASIASCHETPARSGRRSAWARPCPEWADPTARGWLTSRAAAPGRRPDAPDRQCIGARLPGRHRSRPA